MHTIANIILINILILSYVRKREIDDFLETDTLVNYFCGVLHKTIKNMNYDTEEELRVNSALIISFQL